MPDIQALLVGKRLLVAPLYVDDHLLSQIILGEKAKQWPAVRAMLQREGMPDPRRAMGGLYYLPAQLQFLDAREGVLHIGPAGYAEDGPANFGA
jgi:hypothetical protein